MAGTGSEMRFLLGPNAAETRIALQAYQSRGCPQPQSGKLKMPLAEQYQERTNRPMNATKPALSLHFQSKCANSSAMKICVAHDAVHQVPDKPVHQGRVP